MSRRSTLRAPASFAALVDEVRERRIPQALANDLHEDAPADGVRRAAADALHPIPEREIRRLHHFKQSFVAHDFRFGDVGKHRVAFEFGNRHQRLDALHEQFKQFGEDLVRMFEFRLCYKRRVARNVGDDEKSVLGGCGHD